MKIESITPNEPLLKAIIDDLKLPENRKETVTNLMLFTVDFLTNNQIHLTHSITRESDGMTLSSDDLMKVNNVFTPLILRASLDVDIPQDEIKIIYNDFIFEYIIAMREIETIKDSRIDWEAIYIYNYANQIINRLQK